MQIKQQFIREIRDLVLGARRKAYTLVNRAMIEAYWTIGRRIIEEEQQGSNRAQYGAFLLRELGRQLTLELGKGLDERELRKIRQFYLCFPIRDALRPELTWTHYRCLIRVEDARARDYYLKEAADQGWGTRQLERNVQSGYYHRLLSTRQPGNQQQDSDLSAADLIKDPFVLEFLGVPPPAGFSESELETALLAQLQYFLLELGKGFAFVGRQHMIKTDTRIYYIDLVFYNYLLKCFVLVDLKITGLDPRDIGQMDMYVRMFEDLKKLPGDSPTIGIILCADKDATMARYSVLEENQQLFASTYRLYLPTEEELTHEIQREQRRLDPG